MLQYDLEDNERLHISLNYLNFFTNMGTAFIADKNEIKKIEKDLYKIIPFINECTTMDVDIYINEKNEEGEFPRKTIKKIIGYEKIIKFIIQ